MIAGALFYGVAVGAALGALVRLWRLFAVRGEGVALR